MFRPERMRLVAVMAPELHIELLTAAIARAGMLHLVDAPRLPAFASTRPRNRGQKLLERIRALETRAQDLTRRLKVSGGRRPRVSLSLGAEGFLDRIDRELAEAERAVGQAQGRIDRARAEEVRLDDISALLELVEGEGASVEDLRGGVFDRVFLGFVSAEDATRMRQGLRAIPCGLASGPAGRGRCAICVATSAGHEEEIKRALSAVGFVAASVPEDVAGSVAAAREEIEERAWAAREDEAEARAEIEDLREKQGGELVQWLVEIAALRQIEEASLQYASTGTLEIVVGWTPLRLLGALRRLADRVTGGKVVVTEISESDAAGAPGAPTSLRNPVGIRAFESIVGLYGTPPYDGIDPTAFLALSFTLMFGAMFGDIGHGLVLAGVGLALWRFFRGLSRSGRDIGEVLVFCGLASAFFGVLFGSIFGNERWLEEHLMTGLLAHPLAPQNINATLAMGLGIGVFMLSLGVVLNVVQQFMRRRWKDALIGEWGVASLAFYWGLMGLLAYAMLSPGATKARLAVLLAVLVAPPILLTAFRGPIGRLVGRLRGGARRDEREHEEDIMTTTVGAAVMALETVTNTFSHIRVAAFALNHAALCTAVFMIAGVLREAGANDALATSTVVLGNVVIIALEGLIVFIQSMRLHFYEFFSKFFLEMGTPYAPLRIE